MPSIRKERWHSTVEVLSTGSGSNLSTLGSNSLEEIPLMMVTSTAHQYLLSPPPSSGSPEATQGAWFDPALGKMRRYKCVTGLDGARQGQTVKKGGNSGTTSYSSVISTLLSFTYR